MLWNVTIYLYKFSSYWNKNHQKIYHPNLSFKEVGLPRINPEIIIIGNDKEIYVPKWYQSLGMDQRVEQLEQNVSSWVSGQQQLIEKMADIYAKISELSSRREEGEGSHVASGKRPEGRWQPVICSSFSEIEFSKVQQE